MQNTITSILVVCVAMQISHMQTARGAQDDLSWIRGANYVPSYARNDVQTWMDYDPTVVDRELGYAERMKLNTVRVFLQYAVYERDPKLFLQRFESFLGLCAKHHIQMMPVVFDSCFGEFPDLEKYREKDWMACPGQNRLGAAHWPKLEQYVRDVVGAHKDDKRIVLWDVMNEPTCTTFDKPEDKKLIATFLGHFLDYVKEQDPNHPRCVGFLDSSENKPLLDKLDVVAIHNYRRDLREDIRGMKALGKPVIVNEVACRPGQPFDYVMPIFREEKCGWCFWELMLGKTQFHFLQGGVPYQGVIYPDGTCFDAGEIAAIMNVSRDEAARLFPQRPKPKLKENGITFDGFWTRWTGQGPHKDRLYYANTAGATATWQFNGTTAALIHKIGPDCGIARILIDGNPATPVELDTYSPNVEWNHRTVLTKDLAKGQHTVTVEWTGKKNPQSTNTYVQIVDAERE